MVPHGRQAFCPLLADILANPTVVLSDVAALVPPWELVAAIAIVFFAAAGIAAYVDRIELERRLSTLGWVTLAGLWLVMLPYFALEAQSPLETLGVVVGIPLSLWIGLGRWRGRDRLVVLGNAVALAGLIYVPASTIEPIRRGLIETVAGQTHWLMGFLGHQPGLVADQVVGYTSMFDFDGHTTYIVMACTGLGSIAVFAGAIFAVNGELKNKLLATGLIAVIIYSLNLVRNVFVGLATPFGWFDFEPFLSITSLLGVEATRNSYYVAHTIIAQPASLVAVLGLTVLALRLVPGLFSIFDEIVYVLTGDEVDLRSEFGHLFGDGEASTSPTAD